MHVAQLQKKNTDAQEHTQLMGVSQLHAHCHGHHFSKVLSFTSMPVTSTTLQSIFSFTGLAISS
jgi:hypothetical protein